MAYDTTSIILTTNNNWVELASIITINREQTEVVTNQYQMQDISNVSHWGINPPPSLDTTIQAVADDRTLPPDDTKNDTFLHAGNHTDLLKLGQYINEPGPNHVYHHIMREILKITPGCILDKLIVARLRGRQDAISLKYFSLP